MVAKSSLLPRILPILRKQLWLGLGFLLLVVLIALFTVPNPPTAGGFTSGGLGLTRAEWRRQYKPCSECYQGFFFSEPTYEDEKEILYSVQFWPEGWLTQDEARIMAIGPFYWRSSGEAEQTLSRRLLPTDAQFQGTVEDPVTQGGFIDIYHSTSLETRYPRRIFAPDPWQGAKPGTIYLLRDHGLAITIPGGMYAPNQPLATPGTTPSAPIR